MLCKKIHFPNLQNGNPLIQKSQDAISLESAPSARISTRPALAAPAGWPASVALFSGFVGNFPPPAVGQNLVCGKFLDHTRVGLDVG